MKANKLRVAFVGFIVLIIIGISSCGGSATPSGGTSSIDSGSPVGSSTVTASAPAPPPTTTAAVPAPATTTAPTTAAPPPPAPTSAPAAVPTTSSGCYPLTNRGNCYKPGEYCRKSDHGASGVAGDGKHIVCENNNGWRWEPV
jgi:hypothetical protein